VTYFYRKGLNLLMAGFHLSSKCNPRHCVGCEFWGFHGGCVSIWDHDGGSMDLWNVGILQQHYTASQPTGYRHEISLVISKTHTHTLAFATKVVDTFIDA